MLAGVMAVRMGSHTENVLLEVAALHVLPGPARWGAILRCCMSNLPFDIESACVSGGTERRDRSVAATKLVNAAGRALRMLGPWVG